MASYLGFTVLDLTEPDRADGTRDEFERRIYELNSQTGIRSVDVPSPADTVVREFQWASLSRAEVKVLRSFIDARNGRGIAFWLLGWEHDLRFLPGSESFENPIFIDIVGYTANVFPIGSQRRHLAVRDRTTNAVYFRKVLSALVTATEEQLTLDSSMPAFDTDFATISFLRFARLDTDEPRIEWSGGQYARCALPIRELPLETPA